MTGLSRGSGHDGSILGILAKNRYFFHTPMDPFLGLFTMVFSCDQIVECLCNALANIHHLSAQKTEQHGKTSILEICKQHNFLLTFANSDTFSYYNLDISYP